MAGGNLAGFALRFAGNAILARFIAPEQFGTYAQASVYAAFLGLLQAVSFPQALLQLPDLPGLVATVRRMTLLLSVFIMGLGLVLWPVVAALRDAAVGHCFVGLVFAQGVVSVGLAYEQALQRVHHWHAASGLRLIANVVSAGAVIPLGIALPGPFVLVLRDALAPLLVIGMIAYSARRARHEAFPNEGFHRDTAQRVWELGRSLFWNRALEAAFFKVDSLLVGELLGKRTLGLYDQARYLAALPNTALGPVASTVGLRVLAQLKDDHHRRARAFALLQWGIARVVFVFALGAALAPELAIRIVYGSAWVEAAPILQALALWTLLVPVAVNHQILLTALQLWRPIRIGFIAATLTLAAVVAPLALLLGAPGVALAHTTAVAAQLVVWARGTAGPLGLQAKDHLRIGLPPLFAGLIGLGAGLLVESLLAPGYLGATLGLLAGFTASGLALIALEGQHMRRELRYIREVLRRRDPPVLESPPAGTSPAGATDPDPR